MAQPHATPFTGLRLSRYLAARLGPLAVLLALLVSVAAPVAFYLMGLREVRSRATASARQVAEVIRREAEQRPRLWKYDSLKLVAHLKANVVHEDVASIQLTDANGVAVELDPPHVVDALSQAPVLWSTIPLFVYQQQVGEVWVAASTVGVRRTAMFLLVPFGILGIGLAFLMYMLPVRAMYRAETRIGLSTRAVNLLEAERRAIARELHDSTGQSITAIRINVQLMGELVGGPNPDLARLEQLALQSASMVDDTLEEIRRAVAMLGPAILDAVGLRKAIVSTCDDFSERTSIEVVYDLDLPETGLSPAIESTVYRLAQETLTNVARHSEATRVEISVAAGRTQLQLAIQDNGKGFVPAEVDPRSTRGLVGMHERVELQGGSYSLRSAPGEGTEIRVMLPIVDVSSTTRA